jgi:hypothetical protein
VGEGREEEEAGDNDPVPGRLRLVSLPAINVGYDERFAPLGNRVGYDGFSLTSLETVALGQVVCKPTLLRHDTILFLTLLLHDELPQLVLSPRRVMKLNYPAATIQYSTSSLNAGQSCIEGHSHPINGESPDACQVSQPCPAACPSSLKGRERPILSRGEGHNEVRIDKT